MWISGVRGGGGEIGIDQPQVTDTVVVGIDEYHVGGAPWVIPFAGGGDAVGFFAGAEAILWVSGVFYGWDIQINLFLRVEGVLEIGAGVGAVGTENVYYFGVVVKAAGVSVDDVGFMGD